MKRKILRNVEILFEIIIPGICAAIGFILVMALGLLVYSIVFGG